MLLLPDFSEFEPGALMSGVRTANGGAAVIRACYGAGHPDRVFTRLRTAAADFAWLGIYQYLVAGQDATAQAAAFAKLVGKLAPHEIPILDLEEGEGDQFGRAAAWLGETDAALGLMGRPLPQRSWLYSGLNFAETHGLAPIFKGPRRTWVAAYGPNEPTLGHSLWQCSDGDTGPHITDWPGAGRCDTSLYHGTLAELAATTGRVPPAAKPR